MIYTDDELRRWWEAMPKDQQWELLELIRNKSNSERGFEFGESLMRLWESHQRFTPRQLAAIRKWDR